MLYLVVCVYGVTERFAAKHLSKRKSRRHSPWLSPSSSSLPPRLKIFNGHVRDLRGLTGITIHGALLVSFFFEMFGTYVGRGLLLLSYDNGGVGFGDESDAPTRA
jgi:hypothetical protein